MTAKSLSDLLGRKLLMWTLVIGINAVGIASVVGIPLALLVDLILVWLGIRWLVNRLLPASVGDFAGRTAPGRGAARWLLFVLLFGAVVVATGYGYRWLIHSTFWLG